VKRIALVFVERRYNRAGVAVLTGAVEQSAVADAVEVTFAPFRGGAPELPAADLVVAAFSFPSAAAPDAARDLAAVRERAKGRDLVAVAGGPHPSGDVSGTLGLGFDLAIAGEGEEAFPDLLLRLAEDRPIDDVPGLARLEDGRVVANPPPRPVDLDRFPPFAPIHRRNAAFELSRGCAHACRYCQVWSLFGPRLRHRGLDALVSAAGRARANGMRDLRFVSPDAFAWGSADGRTPDPARVEALLRAVSGIFGPAHVHFGSFPAEVRPESVTPEMVGLVRAYCSNDNVVFGLQSASPAMLRRIGRGHGIDEVFRAVEVVRAAGLRPIVDFIWGLPGETAADRAANRSAMERLVAAGATVHSHAFMPLPGTPFAGERPGRVDADTTAFLEALAGRGRHIGGWKTHERRGAVGARAKRGD